MKSFPLSLLTLAFGASLNAQTIFVSPTGNDSLSGTIDSSYRTVRKALSVLQPGGTIYLRGGLYPVDSTIRINASGTSRIPLYLLAYPGETPLLDCSSMAVSGANRGIELVGNFWHIKGIQILNAGDNGMYISGSHNVIEECAFVGNHDTGLQLNNGASDNQIINCDSYDNADPKLGNADGFAAKLAVGTGNTFYGCRAWQNSDDGWDGYMRGANGVTTTIENCWSFMNGYLSNGTAGSGNGNGFKLGGSDSENLEHNAIVKQCIAFDNLAKGFDQNHNRGSMTLQNCSAYRNATNYALDEIVDTGKVITITNCLSAGFYGTVIAIAVQTTNSWMNPFTVSDADFVSLDTSGVRAPRKPDGSLPEISFLHLAKGSNLIDAGTNIGIPFNGAAPDLGAFESDYPSAVQTIPTIAQEYRLEQNYPNPFNPTTTIKYTLAGTRGQGLGASEVRIVIYDVLGREVTMLIDAPQLPGDYEVKFDGSRLASGVYFCRLNAGTFAAARAMLLEK